MCWSFEVVEGYGNIRERRENKKYSILRFFQIFETFCALDVWGSWGVWRHRWGQWSALRLLPAAPHLPSRPAIPAKRFSLALFKPTHIETEEKTRMLWLPIPSILRCKRLEHHLWFTLGHPESPQGDVEVAILALPKLPYHFCESIRRGTEKVPW